MISSNSQHQPSFIVQIPPSPESKGGLDIGRHFREIHFTVVGLEDFLHPRAGGINALVLPPERAQDFDEKTTRSTGSVSHADLGELSHQLVRAFEIAFLTTDGLADFIHDLSDQ